MNTESSEIHHSSFSDHRYPKRLIEVDLPIKRISAHARREKSIRHGHLSTLHIRRRARRPLPACRAVICAARFIQIPKKAAQIEPGKKQTFVAGGRDQHDRDFAVGDVQWHATGGTIDRDGVFLAGSDEGGFVVTAKAGQISGSATFHIASGKEPSPPPPAETKGLSWCGEVPPQKWMNFYTKVLSRFAVGRVANCRCAVVSPRTAGFPAAAEEMRVALRELGLDDEVKIR